MLNNYMHYQIYFIFHLEKTSRGKKTQTKLLYNELPNEKLAIGTAKCAPILVPFRDVHVRDGRRFRSHLLAGLIDIWHNHIHLPVSIINKSDSLAKKNSKNCIDS